jgi:hypothetical protein
VKLSICTDCLGSLSFEAMLDEVAELGVAGVEMTGGGWSPAPHLRADELLADTGKRKAALSAIESRGLEIAALNVSGNPLDPGELGERQWSPGDQAGRGCRQPRLELCRGRLRQGPSVVEGVFLRGPDDGLRRLGLPRDGRSDDVR